MATLAAAQQTGVGEILRMTKEQITKALDDAFNAHVSLLFGVLCSGIVTEADTNVAITRFESGFRAAQLAHKILLDKLTG